VALPVRDVKEVAAQPYFTHGAFQFMKDLADNNDREWFAKNKPRFETHIKDASLRFISDFAPHLKKLSPHFMATPRSLFRIYRDTRFLKDKTPYKRHVGIHFRHEQAKNAYAPGYYLHIEPGEVFAGMGIWHPESKALRAIREHIVAEPAGWKKASRGKTFLNAVGLVGDKLSRPPKGFDPEHPIIEDPKFKDFIAITSLTQKFVLNSDLPKELKKRFRAGTPFMRYLCDALKVPF
jgi:uncharacterized protein (TIGR02453 family)